MRLRSLALAALATASLAPLAAQAGNREDCDSPIDIRSGAGIISPSNGVNCDGLQANEITYSPIIPGGSADVFLTGAVDPINGSRPGNYGSFLEYDSMAATGAITHIKTYLTWSQADGLQGPIAGSFASQPISFGAKDSVIAGPIRVVMWDRIADPLNPEQCHPVTGCYTLYERVFHTASEWVDGV